MNVVKKIMTTVMFFVFWMCCFGTVFAMHLSQPEEIGLIGYLNGFGFHIRGATNNQGTYSQIHDHNGKKYFDKGLARFGSGDDALYMHYNAHQEKNRGCVYCGGENIDNTVQLCFFYYPIHRVNTDVGITLYPIWFSYGAQSQWHIIGRRTDGKFVEYIDTEKISKMYFGDNINKNGGHNIICKMLECNGDTIVIRYNVDRERREDDGELRFKWDESAQWFSVENIVY